MPEPNTTAATATGGLLVATAIAAVGPVLGPYLVIALAAFAGSFVALTMRPPSSTKKGAAVIARGMVVALVATGLLAWGLSSTVPGLKANDWLLPLAFLIGLQPEWALRRLRKLTGEPDDKTGGIQ